MTARAHLVFVLPLTAGLLVAGCKSGGGGGQPAPSAPAVSRLSVELPALPRTPEAFLSLRDQVATTPQGGAAMFLAALEVYSEDAAAGMPLLTLAIDMKHLTSGNAYQGKEPARIKQQAWKERIGAKPYLARSYFDGTSPANDYTIPAGPVVVSFKEVRDLGAGKAKVFVFCSGADSARPITLSQNDKGLWKADEWSSVEVGCRPPASSKPKDDF